MAAEIVELAAQGSAIEGLQLITMKQVTDARGTVREFYRESAFVAAGLPLDLKVPPNGSPCTS